LALAVSKPLNSEVSYIISKDISEEK
jgi:hypothetical protein